MQARIKEKRDVAKGTLMVVFDLLGEEVEFTAGQYFWVTLLDPPYDDDKGRAAISRWSRRRTSGACWAWPRACATQPSSARSRSCPSARR